ncbi:serine/threonine-protein kinase [Archangium lansingense]|uniref:Serine/threonine-protein kinase n=1 Tax=Archangium lansingense TaxID=2995310 RepID=A0ABT4ALQ3_9BACT|nr:serine/threonine-protein kinase [Archangium lansinium]MCY1082633.1 serine/threonine-protein kinase [Archangium lansinium]
MPPPSFPMEAALPSPPPGHVLAERYTVLNPLGHGGMGLVLAAYDARLNRRVALKLLRPRWGLDDGDDSQVRLLREAQAMARLNSPHVVHVYDAGRLEDDSVFIAMEYVEGRTLRQWLQQQPRTWREVLRAFLEAGQGLAAAHAAGLVHRDFKPDNVLVGQDGRVRVTDFGLAQAAPASDASTPVWKEECALPRTWVEPLTESGGMLGTPRYMAPEQLQGRPVDARSDLFTFCVALYEALYDQRPFAGDSEAELLEARLAERITPVPAQTEVPTWVARAVLRGLRADPLQRPSSLRELLEELENDPKQPAASTRRWVNQRTEACELARQERADQLPRLAVLREYGLERQVDRLAALHHTGKYKEGLSLAEQLWPRVEALGHPPLSARVLYWNASLQDGAGDYKGAEASLREALVLSAQGKDTLMETRAWNLLVTVVGTRQARHAEALWMELPLRASTERLGDARQRALMHETLGSVRWSQGENEQAREDFARALALLEQLPGHNEVDLSRLLNRMGNVLLELDQYEQAQVRYERALAIEEKNLGPDHLAVATTCVVLGQTLVRLGKWDEAARYLRRAQTIGEKPFHQSPVLLAHALLGWGELRLARGQPAAAIPLLERALAHIETRSRAEVQWHLARTLWEAGAEHARARDLAIQAQESFRSLRQQRQLARVTQWLATHPL